MDFARRLLAGGLLALLISVGGCAGQQHSRPAMAPMTQEERAALKPQKGDEAILAAVKDAFAKDPEISAEQIEVTVTDGRVTLSGTVASMTVRMRAETMAREVPEVFGVDADRLLAR